MSKTIDTLEKDIDDVLKSASNPWTASIKLPDELVAEFAARLATHTIDTVSPNRSSSPHKPLGTIWISELGKPCIRKLWYDRYLPYTGAVIEPNAQVKFLYGDYLEELVLLLAEAAGHKVTDRQAPISYLIGSPSGITWTVKGRIDAVIDGTLVDVKSMSPYGMQNLRKGLKEDSFGYKAQLSGYNGLIIPTFDRQGFVGIDKQNGHITWAEMPWQEGEKRAREIIAALEQSTDPPRRAFTAVSQSDTSRNMKLQMECSYCEYKWECWKQSNKGRGLRQFNYASGPVFLTDVVDAPKVEESVPSHVLLNTLYEASKYAAPTGSST